MFIIWFLIVLEVICIHGFNNSAHRELMTNFTVDYFKTRNIQNVIAFVCWPIKERVELLKYFSAHGIRVSLPNNSAHKNEKKDLEDLFRLENTLMGAMFDDYCYYQVNASYTFKYNYFNASYVWLMFSTLSFERSVQLLDSLPLTISADIVVVKIVTSNDTIIKVDMYDVYNPGYDRGGKLNVTFIGSWGEKNWIHAVRKPKVRNRYDLRGMTIRTVTYSQYRDFKMDMHVYLTDERNPNIDGVFKSNYQLILFLKDLYNFTIKFVIADNWSDKNVNGLYRSGNLLGVLGDKKADIMAGALQLMQDRIAITDVIHLTYPFRSGFVFRYSGDFGELNTNFLAPFVSTAWYFFLLLTVILLASIWLISIFENKYWRQEETDLWRFSDSFLSVWGAWCQMGTELRPSSVSSRLIYFTLFLNSLIIYNFYTSSIVSSLLNYRSKKFTIPTLADSPLVCGSVDVGYVHNLLFDTPQDSDMAYFNSKKKTDNFYFTMNEGVRRVKKGGFAYHAEFSTLYQDIENTFEATEICELQEVDTIKKTPLYILALKYSPYSEMFKVGLLKTRESGQVQRLLNKYVSRKPICQSSKGVSEVNIHQIASNFIILSGGLIIAIILIMYEKKKFKKSQQMTTDIHIKFKKGKKK